MKKLKHNIPTRKALAGTVGGGLGHEAVMLLADKPSGWVMLLVLLAGALALAWVVPHAERDLDVED